MGAGVAEKAGAALADPAAAVSYTHLSPEKQYLTVGINGFLEGAEALGMAKA